MQIPTTYFPTSTYTLEEKNLLKIGEQEHESALSYNLYIETSEDEKQNIFINRTNLKVDGEKINTRFLEIANRYMEALFPLECTIEKFRLKIINLSEIKKRIKEEDQKITDQYSGDGIDHIRNQFFNATENDEKLSEFIKQLYFMKVLNLGMQKFEKKQDYFLKWKILPIGFSEWKGSIDFSKEQNQLHFEPKIDNAQEIMDNVIQYIHKHEYEVDFDEENIELFADFRHQVQYTGKTGRIETAQTEVCIDIKDKFYYQQQVIIQSK
ncbi:hypothetical protein NAL32_21510 [Chryseobacterium sp. Ch-15]|uniref:Uncharacterized protein n=1 Tax=Chryseobacterium muglaense TaxID=2893752 RepID=A0A9Q3UWQ8_9FLAO|nr:hypothetical protein [Chryseobacterium muglaense]MBD3907303.1 hypothetical protein [Chryseobacterium muglaense]MCC9036514.1 hypothetical protein [Chryseobacterium muglaense]MCM2556970.1 hypothetical protein [Chryseobacterium muglaense]